MSSAATFMRISGQVERIVGSLEVLVNRIDIHADAHADISLAVLAKCGARREKDVLFLEKLHAITLRVFSRSRDLGPYVESSAWDLER